jgi:hypothetical protein
LKSTTVIRIHNSGKTTYCIVKLNGVSERKGTPIYCQFCGFGKSERFSNPAGHFNNLNIFQEAVSKAVLSKTESTPDIDDPDQESDPNTS